MRGISASCAETVPFVHIPQVVFSRKETVISRRPRAIQDHQRTEQIHEDYRAAEAEFCAHCGERLRRGAGGEVWQRERTTESKQVIQRNYCGSCVMLDEAREFIGKDPPAMEMC